MWQITLCVAVVLGITLNGIPGSHSRHTSRIIGGNEVDIEQYPHQVALVYHGHTFCGGSIISDEYVLTAAHCVVNKRAKSIRVRVGSSYRTVGGELYNVTSYDDHVLFGRGDYDIAVIRIDGKIKIDGKTSKIVKLADFGSKLKHGQIVTVSGWGFTDGLGDPSEVLKATTLPVVERKTCAKIWEFKLQITSRMICAGTVEPGPAACEGDSGGPLIDENFVQYGIVSFGDVVCQGKPTVFTSVAKLRDWISWKTGV